MRDRNEDSYLVQHLSWLAEGQPHEVALLVIADGMGGHRHGQRASSEAIRSIGDTMSLVLTGALNGQFQGATSETLGGTLDYALQNANQTLAKLAAGEPASRGMGTTAVVCLVWDGVALISHLGDCRAYHYQSELRQLTKDQTLVNRMVELGQLTPKEARHHPARNEVLQALGRRAEIQPGRAEVQLVSGDWLVLACDGLHTDVDESSIQQAVGLAVSAGQLADHLVEMASARGGRDNCTVIAVRCY